MALICGDGCKKAPEPVVRPNSPSTDPGWFERADCEALVGWACDPDHPDDPVMVYIYDENSLLKTVKADIPRPDVAKAKKNSGKHGFAVALPPSLRDGSPHYIHVVVAGTKVELNHSPRIVRCPMAGGRK
jgi:hypothetical protein